MFRDASQFITVRGTNIARLESGHLKYAASRDLHLDDLNTILKENPTEKDSCQGYDGSKTSLVYWNCCCNKWHIPGLYAFQGHVYSSCKRILWKSMFYHGKSSLKHSISIDIKTRSSNVFIIRELWFDSVQPRAIVKDT